MSSKTKNDHKTLAVKASMIAVMSITLLISAVVLSLPYYISLARAQPKNQTTGAANSGVGNINTIPKITNQGPGNNTQIILKNKNIGNPNAFKAFGKEHAITAKTPSSIRQLPNMTSGGNTSSSNNSISSAQKGNSNAPSSGNSSQPK
jgi:hypothetical protein